MGIHSYSLEKTFISYIRGYGEIYWIDSRVGKVNNARKIKDEMKVKLKEAS
jgi:hypothetical protein